MTIPFPESIRPKTVYQVYIEWDHDDTDKGLAVHKAIDKLKTPGDVWHTDQIGGACWNAYLQIQGTNFGEVKEFSEGSATDEASGLHPVRA